MESSIEFNQDLAVSLYQSIEKFPIDLEEATIWLRYYDKSTAKRGFLNAKFIEGIDTASLPKRQPRAFQPIVNKKYG